MSSDEREGEQTQATEKGLKIPVPTRERVFEDLRKIAPPVHPEREADEDGS